MWQGGPSQQAWWPVYNTGYAPQAPNGVPGGNTQDWAGRAAMWAQQRQMQEQFQAHQQMQAQQAYIAAYGTGNPAPPVSQQQNLPEQHVNVAARDAAPPNPVQHERVPDMQPNVPGIEIRLPHFEERQVIPLPQEQHAPTPSEQPRIPNEHPVHEQFHHEVRHDHPVDEGRERQATVYQEPHHKQTVHPSHHHAPPSHHHHHHHRRDAEEHRLTDNHHSDNRHGHGTDDRRIAPDGEEVAISPFGRFGPPPVKEHTPYQAPPVVDRVVQNDHLAQFNYGGPIVPHSGGMVPPLQHGMPAHFPFPMNEFGQHPPPGGHPFLQQQMEEQFLAGEADSMKKKILPQWLREGLEKMEKDKGKKDPKLNASLPSSVEISGYQHELEGSPPASPSEAPKLGMPAEESNDGFSHGNQSVKSDVKSESDASSEEEDEDQKQQLLMQRVKKMITDVLMSVTASEIAKVAEEVCNQARAKVESSKQLRHSVGLDALRMGFGSDSGSEEGNLSDDRDQLESLGQDDDTITPTEAAEKGGGRGHLPRSYQIDYSKKDALSVEPNHYHRQDDEQSPSEKRSDSEKVKKSSRSKKSSKRKHRSPSQSRSVKKAKHKSDRKESISRNRRDNSEERRHKRKRRSKKEELSDSSSSDSSDATGSSNESQSTESSTGNSSDSHEHRHRNKSKKKHKHRIDQDKSNSSSSRHRSGKKGKKQRKHKSKSSRSYSPSRKHR